MRVAILSPYPTFRFHQELGCRKLSHQNNATWTVILAQALAQLPQTEVHVVTETEDIPASRTICHDGVHLHFVRAPARFKTLTLWQFDRLRLHRALRDINPDVVHGQGIENQYGYAAVSSGRPCLVTIHGIPKLVRSYYGGAWFDRQRLVEMFENHSLKRARNLVIINPFVTQAYGLDSSRRRLFQIPNAIAESFFAATPLSREPNQLISVGTIEERKGFDLVLEAMALLKSRGLTPRLKILGGIPPGGEEYQRRLERIVAEHGIKVEFTGGTNHERIADEMRRCHAMVHAARHETAPMTVAEAMASGTPLVASRVGGVPHMIDDGKNGLVVESGNVVQLADQLERLLRDPLLCQQLGVAAAKTARDTYHPQRVAELTRAAYAEIARSNQAA